MSGHAQGAFVPEDPEPKPERAAKPDDGLCCVCRAPRADGFRYLCPACSDESVDRALRIEVAVAAMRERRICDPVAGEGAR